MARYKFLRIKSSLVKFPTAIDSLIIGACFMTILLLFFKVAVWLIGLVWAVVIGMAVGSYATSLVARIPKRVMSGARPYCMNCKTNLKARDLYPIFSYLFNKRRCRFCATKIPAVLFCTESLVTMSFVLSFCYFGFNYHYIISSFLMTLMIIFVTMLINDRFFSKTILACCLLIGVLWYWK